ncbi:(2Fe-2S)-binding protein [Actinoplanes sp. G11-F43]|uniref:(2Fe-2S)-binding protein n=1 Tax=Actinoplanes sp. G11-F43 TaxID=3424130 RepID=UPI003D34C00B
MTADAGAALDAAARLGPYFAWERYDGAPGWRPLPDLLDAGVLEQRVDLGRRMLARMGGFGVGDIEERVVASTIFLGLASRLLSPLLGAVASTGVLPLPDPARLWWRPVESGPMPVAFHDLPVETGVDGFGAAFTRTATRGLIVPLAGAVQRRFVLSPQVVWGNVASALGGALRMIPDAGPAVAVVGSALSVPPLRGMATLTGRSLMRNNCCLYYRIPGGGTCGDCVLNTR